MDTSSIIKITGSVGEHDPKRVREAIKHFKNERYPSIAVTVDLLTTGIDVPDELVSHTRGYGGGSRLEDYLDAFSEFIRTNMNEIAALHVVCTRPSDLTRERLKSLRLALDREGFTVQQLNTAVSELTNEAIAADIISLIRCYAIGAELIGREACIRRAVDKLKKNHKFTRQEQSWISRMEKYLIEESVLNVAVFDEDSRFRNA